MDNLSGNLVRLRPVRDEDWDCIASLRNDMRTQARGLRNPPSNTAKTARETMEKDFESPNRGIWIIETKDGKFVGHINYKEERPRLGAVMGIVTGVDHWGKGYAREAMELIIRFLFEERGIQSVYLWTTSWNVRMVGLAKKLGFRISVREREARCLGGTLYDGLFMDMLREECYESKEMKDEMKRDLPAIGGA